MAGDRVDLRGRRVSINGVVGYAVTIRVEANSLSGPYEWNLAGLVARVYGPAGVVRATFNEAIDGDALVLTLPAGTTSTLGAGASVWTLDVGGEIWIGGRLNLDYPGEDLPASDANQTVSVAVAPYTISVDINGSGGGGGGSIPDLGTAAYEDTPSGGLVGVTAAQTLTLKTLTDPKITKTVTTVTAESRTALLTDRSTLLLFDHPDGQVFFLPTNASVAIPIGSSIEGVQRGAGTVHIAGSTGVTITGAPDGKDTQEVGSKFTADKVGTNEWVVSGNVDTSPGILWGIGDTIGIAETTNIYNLANMDMVTGWFNGPGDFAWMGGYLADYNTQMNDHFAAGRAIEMVVWVTDGVDPRPPEDSATSGKTLPEYALSEQFLEDLVVLVNIYTGHGPHYGDLYAVLFTEFNDTYIYDWPGSPYATRAEYNAALMEQYVKAANQIRAQYPKAKVGLGFGGYGWMGPDGDDETIDLTPYQAAFEASDFAAVQAMHSYENVQVLIDQTRAAVKQLGRETGLPVMQSHMKLWANPPASESLAVTAYNTFVANMFTPQSLAQLQSWGLFAWDFMDDNYINDPGTGRTATVALINAS